MKYSFACSKCTYTEVITCSITEHDKLSPICPSCNIPLNQTIELPMLFKLDGHCSRIYSDKD